MNCNGELQSLLKKIKMTALPILLTLILITAGYANKGRSQVILEQKISITLNGEKLTAALKKIGDAAGVTFSYTKEVTDDDKKVWLTVQNKQLKDVLNQLLQPLSIRYEVIDSHVILTKNADAVPKIKGTVLDENGKPMADVGITVKGAKRGTTTNSAGEFTIDAGEKDILVFSYTGYEPVELLAKQNISISLKRSDSQLEQVVVVGYGTQKKIDMTGSVATISSKDIDNRPVTNVSSALAGLASGVYVKQGSGQPGSDGASINIRGVGTLSSTSVLVVVDGIIGSIDAVNPNDVESISVLKDAASAAIYGALSANGVIVITTKKGSRNAQNKPTVTYSGIFSQTTPTGIPQFVSNSAQYMQLINESATNVGMSKVFDSATVIQPFIDASKNPNGLTSLGVPNYVAYPNTNWAKVLIQNKLLQSHNVTVSGANDKTSYNVSLGYLKNPGLINNSQLEKYQFRINLESKINDNITVGTQTFAYYQNTGTADLSNLFNFLVQSSPMIYPYYNGKYGSTSAAGDVIGTASNLLNYTLNTLGTNTSTLINTTWYARFKLIKGLSFEPKVNYQTRFDESNTWGNPVPAERWNFLTMQQVTPPTPSSQLTTSNSFTKYWNYTLEGILRYNTSFKGGHNVGLIGGFNQYYNNQYNTGITERGLIDPSVPALGSATTITSTPTGSATNWSMRSWFGRVNYNYQERYLLEANLRYDGSSRFGPNMRWGTFPSVSAGWNLTKESFLKGLQNHNIQNLKIRASWGQLGNTSSGNYQWQALYGTVPYSFNGTAVTGLRQGSYANSDLHWETTNVTDIGLDMLMFKKLTFTFDWYRRFTDGILFTPPLDPTAGTATAPTINLAQVVNSGIEFNAGWRDRIGKVDFSVNANFSYNYLNKVVKYKGALIEGWSTDAGGNQTYSSNIGAVSAGSNQRIVEGHMINEYYLQTVYHGTGNYLNSDGSVNPAGGPKDGMIRTPQDLTWVQKMIAAGYKFPVNSTGKAQLYYGDLIYADNNGDKQLGVTNDQKFQGVSSTPKYVFGFNLNAAWKGFDVSMIWAGAAGMKYYWNQSYYNSTTVALGGQIPERIAGNHYFYNDANANDPKNNINAYFPRIKYSDNINNVASTFWLYNASYLRLKNLQLGYTVSEKAMGKAGKYVSRVRVFVSGENLLTITQFPGPDPENGTSVGYPSMKQYAFGVNVTF